jgi:hypothetical protein
MATLHRSRYRAIIMHDLRQLRHGLVLSISEAATLLGEHPSLLQTQEEGGSREDRVFTAECARCYMVYAAKRARTHDLPPMTDSSGTSTVYWLRVGLGLKERDCVAILRRSREWIDSVEAGSHPLPDSIRAIAWCGYVDWAHRHYRWQDRLAATRPRTVTEKRKLQVSWSSTESSEFQRLAYTPLLSPTQAEAEARRLLGLP